jgi:pyruvate,water dikinase
MASTAPDRNKASVLWFDELSMRDVGLVGGKNASLGEMYRQLTPRGVKIPNGFAVTSTAFHRFLREADIADEIRRVLTGLDTRDLHDLETRGALVRGLILGKEMPSDIVDDIRKAYVRIENECVGALPCVA